MLDHTAVFDGTIFLDQLLRSTQVIFRLADGTGDDADVVGALGRFGGLLGLLATCEQDDDRHDHDR
jgi:hypothetical protein